MIGTGSTPTSASPARPSGAATRPPDQPERAEAGEQDAPGRATADVLAGAAGVSRLRTVVSAASAPSDDETDPVRNGHPPWFCLGCRRCAESRRQCLPETLRSARFGARQPDRAAAATPSRAAAMREPQGSSEPLRDSRRTPADRLRLRWRLRLRSRVLALEAASALEVASAPHDQPWIRLRDVGLGFREARGRGCAGRCLDHGRLGSRGGLRLALCRSCRGLGWLLNGRRDDRSRPASTASLRVRSVTGSGACCVSAGAEAAGAGAGSSRFRLAGRLGSGRGRAPSARAAEAGSRAGRRSRSRRAVESHAEMHVGHRPFGIAGAARSRRLSAPSETSSIPLHRDRAKMDERDRVAVARLDRDAETVGRGRAGEGDRSRLGASTGSPGSAAATSIASVLAAAYGSSPRLNWRSTDPEAGHAHASADGASDKREIRQQDRCSQE